MDRNWNWGTDVPSPAGAARLPRGARRAAAVSVERSCILGGGLIVC